MKNTWGVGKYGMVWEGSAVFAASSLLFWFTRTRCLNWDSILYLMGIEKTDHLFYFGLFHPHHLLFNFFSYVCYQWAQLLGYSGPAGPVLQVVNVAFAGLGVMFFYFLAFYLTKQKIVAFLSACFLFSSRTYWMFSSQIEVYPISTCFLILLFWIMVQYLKDPSIKKLTALAVIHAVAILFQQTLIVFFVPILCVFLLNNHLNKRNKIRFFISYFFLLMLFSAGPYYLVWKYLFSTKYNFSIYFSYYSKIVHELGLVNLKYINNVLIELKRTFLTPIQKPNNTVIYSIIIAIFIIFILILKKGFKALLKANGKVMLISIIGASLYISGLLYWRQIYYKLYVSGMVPLLIIFILFLNIVYNNDIKRKDKVLCRGSYVVLSLLIIFMASNFYYSVLPKTSIENCGYHKAIILLSRYTNKGDLVVMPQSDLAAVYLPYYGKRETLTIAELKSKKDGGPGNLGEMISEAIKEKTQQGKNVFILSGALKPDYRLEQYGMSQDQLDQIWKGIKDRLHPVKTFDSDPWLAGQELLKYEPPGSAAIGRGDRTSR